MTYNPKQQAANWVASGITTYDLATIERKLCEAYVAGLEEAANEFEKLKNVEMDDVGEGYRPGDMVGANRSYHLGKRDAYMIAEATCRKLAQEGMQNELHTKDSQDTTH